MSKRRTGTPEVYTITSTREPLADDLAKRARRYMLQMGLRTVCFLGAVFTWGKVPAAISVTLLIGAVVLPYIAVVLANAGRERPEQADPFLEIARQLNAAPVAPARTSEAAWQDGTVRRGGDRPLWDHDGPIWDHSGPVRDQAAGPDGPLRDGTAGPDGPRRG